MLASDKSWCAMSFPMNSHHVMGGMGLGCQCLGAPLHPTAYASCRLAFPQNILSVIRLLIYMYVQLSSESCAFFFLLKKAHLRRAGHVVRMIDERLPKRLLCGKLSEGKRYSGGQCKRCKSSLKSTLKSFEINNESRVSLATERGTWRCLIRKGAESYEQSWTRQARRKKRDCSANQVLRKQPLRLLLLFRVRTAISFCARIGLISHIWIHRLHVTDQRCRVHHPRRMDEQAMNVHIYRPADTNVSEQRQISPGKEHHCQ